MLCRHSHLVHFPCIEDDLGTYCNGHRHTHLVHFPCINDDLGTYRTGRRGTMLIFPRQNSFLYRKFLIMTLLKLYGRTRSHACLAPIQDPPFVPFEENPTG